MPARLALLYCLFAVSGFCGLIYESIWAKYVKLFLGHAAYAQTVVLLVFIGGMAIGAWLCGRFAQRIRRPLIAYAMAEFVVGLFAIGFHANFVRVTDWGYSTLLPSACDATGFCIASWVLAAALILPQSILLGTTFPLMTAGVLRAFPETPGRKLSLLYFLNSIGAVFGVLASTFVLVPWVGLPGTSLTAGMINCGLALAVYVLARTASSSRPPVASDAATANVATIGVAWLLWVALLTGLSSFVYEIVWIRMLSLVLGSSTHAFELMLASFILGLALGSAWIRARIDALRDARGFLAVVQIVMGLLALLTVPLYNHFFDAMAWLMSALARDDNGYALFNIGSSLMAMALMLPATFMAGMTLPLITFLLLRGRLGERSIGFVYSANTLGSICGVLLAIHVGLPLLGLKGSLASAAAIDVLLGVLLISTATPRRSGWGYAAAAAIGAISVAAGMVFFEIDPMKAASGVFRSGQPLLDSKNKIVFHRDGKTSTVDVVENENGLVSIRTNGKSDAAIQKAFGSAPPTPDEFTMALAAALPLAYRPHLEKAAVIGFGSGLTTAMLLGAPGVKRVDTIEIEPAMVAGANAFRPRVERAYVDSRSRIIIDDAKSYFARARERYDLIFSEPSNPWVSGVSSLYTEEFYRRISGYLADEGLFVQWVQMYEFNPALLASIARAMDPVFNDYVAYNTDQDLLIVASRSGKLGEPRPALFAMHPLAEELRILGISNLRDLQSRRLMHKTTMNSLLFAKGAGANSDYFPFVDLHAARARFKGERADSVMTLGDAPIPVVEIVEAWPRIGVMPASRPPLPGLARPMAAFDADRIVEFLQTSRPGDDRPIPNFSRPLLGVAAYRSILVDCAEPSNANALWDEVLKLAEYLNRSAPPAALDSVWKAAASSRCLARLPHHYRDWLELFRSVGNREAEGMVRYANSLLELRDKTPAQIEYLVLAVTAGHVARGDAAQARIILDDAIPAFGPGSKNLAWFEYLRRVTGAK